MIYLLIISFILHLVSFFFIVLLYQRQLRQEPFNKEKTLNEMEDILVSYTTEMKENNERMVRIVSRQTKTPPAQFSKARETAEENTEPFPGIEEALEMKTKAGEFSQYVPPLPDEKEAQDLSPSPASQILSLHQQGNSIKEIAQKLKLGTGEVELLLKFHK